MRKIIIVFFTLIEVSNVLSQENIDFFNKNEYSYNFIGQNWEDTNTFIYFNKIVELSLKNKKQNEKIAYFIEFDVNELFDNRRLENPQTYSVNRYFYNNLNGNPNEFTEKLGEKYDELYSKLLMLSQKDTTILVYGFKAPSLYPLKFDIINKIDPNLLNESQKIEISLILKSNPPKCLEYSTFQDIKKQIYLSDKFDNWEKLYLINIFQNLTSNKLKNEYDKENIDFLNTVKKKIILNSSFSTDDDFKINSKKSINKLDFTNVILYRPNIVIFKKNNFKFIQNKGYIGINDFQLTTKNINLSIFNSLEKKYTSMIISEGTYYGNFK